MWIERNGELCGGKSLNAGTTKRPPTKPGGLVQTALNVAVIAHFLKSWSVLLHCRVVAKMVSSRRMKLSCRGVGGKFKQTKRLRPGYNFNIHTVHKKRKIETRVCHTEVETVIPDEVPLRDSEATVDSRIDMFEEIFGRDPSLHEYFCTPPPYKTCYAESAVSNDVTPRRSTRIRHRQNGSTTSQSNQTSASSAGNNHDRNIRRRCIESESDKDKDEEEESGDEEQSGEDGESEEDEDSGEEEESDEEEEIVHEECRNCRRRQALPDEGQRLVLYSLQRDRVNTRRRWCSFKVANVRGIDNIVLCQECHGYLDTQSQTNHNSWELFWPGYNYKGLLSN